MNPACSPLGSALANVNRVPPTSPVPHAAVSSITEPRDVPLGRCVPGAPPPPGTPEPHFLAVSPHTDCCGSSGSEDNLWPARPPPQARARPCSAGSFQEMAPLQHPTARRPQTPSPGGGSPAAATDGRCPINLARLFPPPWEGFLQVRLKTEEVKQQQQQQKNKRQAWGNFLGVLERGVLWGEG